MHESKRPLKIFLCHASTDKPKVRELYRYLRRRGINPWFDEEHLVGGQDWQVEIPKALATSDAIIICLTKNSVDKEGYIQKEIKFALDKALEMPEGRIFLIPVKFEECEVPFALSRYQWVDLTIEAGYSKMMKALKFRASQLERTTVEIPKKVVEEENLALEKVAREKEERETAERTEREKAEKIAQEKLALEAVEKMRLEVEEQIRQKAAKEKVEREAGTKAFRETARREAAEKNKRTSNTQSFSGVGRQVFISYSPKDLSFAEQLATDLKKAGLDVWYDVSSIWGGSRWRVEIEKAIKNSNFVIVVLSPDSLASEWVEREFLFASRLERKIIPLMYRSCELPLNYLDLNYIDVQDENYFQNFDEILKALSADSTETTLPDSKTKKSSFKLRTEYVIAIIGAIATIIAALLGSPLLEKIFNSLPTPTVSTGVTQVVTFTFTSSPPSETSQPSFLPTETITSTATPLPTEITDAKGVSMMLVPAGEFTMGSEDILGSSNDLKPVHTIYLTAFYMDKYEVTIARYTACVNLGVCKPPYDSSSPTRYIYYGNTKYDNYPVIYVDWNMAKAYCEWRGGQLPTEAQWEKAARGTNERTYPWGEGLSCKKANYSGCAGNDTTEVGSYEDGQGPYGIYDMAGNVFEIVADWYSAIYYENSLSFNPLGPETGTERLIRGGSWYSGYSDFYESRTYLKSFIRKPLYIEYDGGSPRVGIRCVRDVNP